MFRVSILTVNEIAIETLCRRDLPGAPGALNWDKSPELRAAMVAAAGKIRKPSLCAAAENDLTTESARVVCATISKNRVKAQTIVYPPYRAPRPNAPGHAL